jgi:hypothetical protein
MEGARLANFKRIWRTRLRMVLTLSQCMRFHMRGVSWRVFQILQEGLDEGFFLHGVGFTCQYQRS